ncbi:MAG: endonuclease III [Candidatus Absconditabacterales bacterium]
MLKKIYPNPKTELNYQTPFQLIIAVILSAQTTDKQVNKVTKKLFEKIKKPQDVIKMGLENFRKSIKSIGLYNGKAKNIWTLSQIFVKSDFHIPKEINELKKLPGIGEKTAKVIAHVLFNQKVIAVDTHVHRVVNRIGLVKTKNPNQTSKLLEKIVPNKYKTFAHHALILFGRYHCKARNPLCETCPFRKICKKVKGQRGKVKVKRYQAKQK